MKKTGWQYLRRTIQKNIVSFLAVAFIGGVSIAIYLGMQSASGAVYQKADDYLAENRLQLAEITSPMGLTAQDIEDIGAWEDVDIAEGAYSVMVMTQLPREKITVQALSLGEKLNLPVVVEGELPAKAGELAVEQRFAGERDIKVGDTLVLEHEGQLKADEHVVTAIVNHPAFCCGMGRETRGLSDKGLGYAEYYVSLPLEAFDTAYYYERFTTARVWNEELGQQAYFTGDRTAFEELAARYEDRAPEGWMVSGRESIGDLRGVKSLADSVVGISYALSYIFLVVAVVVCYASISRMIEEQKTLIGVQKAMGFLPGEIMKHYMMYSLVCAAVGILVGWLVGILMVEVIVLYILEENFLLGNIPLFFAGKEALLSSVLCLVIFLATTYATCKKLSGESAVKLLRGETPERRKPFFFEKWAGYRRMNLYSRSMIKNVLNDKGRMMTTIIGVVGCISMLIICLSLKMAIDDAFTRQYDKYFLYNNQLVVDSSAGDLEEWAGLLEEEKISFLQLQDKVRAFRVDGGKWVNSHVVVPGDNEERLAEYMVLQDADSGERWELSRLQEEGGILISQKCAQTYNLAPGSVLEIMDVHGQPKEFKVSGVIEHYLQHHLFVTTQRYYEEVMSESPDASVFLLKGDIDGLYEKVRQKEGFLSLRDNSEWAENADAIYMAIAVCLVLSLAMALLVLLNQITIHINRKKTELAVMRVNGYTLGETKAYIYKDNIVLTALGLLLGCGLGIGLAYVVVLIMERDPSYYVHEPRMLACLYACGVGVLFSVLVNVIALRRIDKLSLRDVSR